MKNKKGKRVRRWREDRDLAGSHPRATVQRRASSVIVLCEVSRSLDVMCVGAWNLEARGKHQNEMMTLCDVDQGHII